MEDERLLERATVLLGEHRFALLATIGTDGSPRVRWMTPTVLPRIKGRLYALSSRRFAKVAEIAADGRVLWTIQSPLLDEVATLHGTARILDDPSLAAELIKAIGPYLQTFWRLARDPRDLVVIETRIDKVCLLERERGKDG